MAFFAFLFAGGAQRKTPSAMNADEEEKEIVTHYNDHRQTVSGQSEERRGKPSPYNPRSDEHRERSFANQNVNVARANRVEYLFSASLVRAGASHTTAGL